MGELEMPERGQIPRPPGINNPERSAEPGGGRASLYGTLIGKEP